MLEDGVIDLGEGEVFGAGDILVLVEVFFHGVVGDGEVIIHVLRQYGHHLWAQDIEGEYGFLSVYAFSGNAWVPLVTGEEVGILFGFGVDILPYCFGFAILLEGEFVYGVLIIEINAVIGRLLIHPSRVREVVQHGHGFL